MTVSLRPAIKDDLPQLLPMVKAYHQFENITMTDIARSNAVAKLLSDASLGVIFMILSDHQSVGYSVLTFGYSIEFGGKDAFIDELYIQPDFRGLGLGQQTLTLLQQKAKSHNICAIHLEVARNNIRAQTLYTQAGFHPRKKYMLMSVHLDA